VNALAHSEVQSLYSAYVEHELPEGELENFVAHLESCQGCLQSLEHFEATFESVRKLPRERAPTMFGRQVLRRVRHRNRRRAAVMPYLAGQFHLPAEAIIPIIIAAAAALLIHVLQ
jgi:anti-sigma factor RsiW